MKTSILALAIALAFSFTPTPAAGGLSNKTKCDSGKLLAAAKFSQCSIKVDFLALKKGAKLSAEKKLELQAKCDTKLTEAYDKLEGKYPETMSGVDDECGSYDDDQNMIDGLVAVSNAVADGSVSADGSGAVDPASDNRTVCEDAGGTWESGTCTAGSSYNCTIAAMCSALARGVSRRIPHYYTNNYVGPHRGDLPVARIHCGTMVTDGLLSRIICSPCRWIRPLPYSPGFACM